jgi:hypothetical protein
MGYSVTLYLCADRKRKRIPPRYLRSLNEAIQDATPHVFGYYCDNQYAHRPLACWLTTPDPLFTVYPASRMRATLRILGKLSNRLKFILAHL